MPSLFSDLELSRRLERAERDATARFVDARARIEPSIGAEWIDVNGTYAMFDGASSPCTQTFGFGLFAPPSAADLDAIEAFFRDRASPVFHEVSPMVDGSHLAMLGGRSYRPIELSSVLYRSIPAALPAADRSSVRVRIVDADEADRWARTLADGWSDVTGVGPACAPSGPLRPRRRS